jgi:hypothetical protein
MLIKVDNKLIKNEKEKAKLRMGGGSWSINLDKVSLKEVDTIEYNTELHTYTISTKDAIDKGFIRFLGGEKKLVIPIEFWEVK